MGESRRDAAEQHASSGGDRLKPYRFKPGQSGNPAGRKSRQKTLEELVERVLRERRVPGLTLEGVAEGRKLPRAEILARVLVAAAERGDLEALRMLLDRLWPKRSTLELEVPAETLQAAEDALDRRLERALLKRANGHDAEADPSGPVGS